MSTEVMPGAAAASWDGDDRGALVIHGFTGTTQSMRPLATAFAEAGMTTEMPRLPGHGTSVDDMIETTFDDWLGHVQAAYEDLAARTSKVLVVGLSMGATLALKLAAANDPAGVIVINPATKPQPEMAEFVGSLLASGEVTMDAIAGDIKKPDVDELAYSQTPLEPLRSLGEGVDSLQGELGSITCPTMICVSPEDHVVPPENSAHLAEHLGGSVLTVELENSYHVATLDNDAGLIIERSLMFADEVFGIS